MKIGAMEAVTAHQKTHGLDAPLKITNYRCSCGYSETLRCDACGLPVVVLIAGGTRCQHAEALIAGCAEHGHALATGRATRWPDAAA